MAWNDGEGKGPWGPGTGPVGGGGGEPPQLDELIRRFRGSIKLPGPWVVLVLGALLWGVTGIHIVQPDEVGVVLRFGKFTKEAPPGLLITMPYPVDVVYKPSITKVQKREMGFVTIHPGPPARYRGLPNESLMLTGDENIVDVWFIVQYRVKDAYLYLFSVTDPDEVLKSAAQSAMRTVVGRTQIDSILTEGREEIQVEVARRLQELLDHYQCGLNVERVQLQDVHPPQEVVAAFKDVASAREDKIKTINQADGYRNDLIPKAKGAAARIVNEAEAYKSEIVSRAAGDAARFTSVLAEYRRAKEVTRERIYLETLEDVLPDVNKVILDAGSGVVPLLPLGDLTKAKGGDR
ncbi:MAG: FtsH protease activity modulator HflK [Myxococcales bacterium]|nr:FtsH protease activity modulator HflK [Myxococcales bacterium]